MCTVHLLWERENIATTIMKTDKVQCQQSKVEPKPIKQCQHLEDVFVLTVNLTGSSITLVKNPLGMSMTELLDYIN